MYKCQYDTAVEAVLAVVGVTILCIGVIAIFMFLEWILNHFVFEFALWPVYAMFGGMLLIGDSSCLIFFCCARKICRFDSDNFILTDRKTTIRIAKNQIEKMEDSNVSFWEQLFAVILAPLSGTSAEYGLLKIFYYNEQNEYSIKRIHVFPHVTKRLKEFGYPVINAK